MIGQVTFARLIFLILLLEPLSEASAAEQATRLAGLDVVVWFEAQETSNGQPVIIFSHGYHGCATQSRFLMEAFAKAGYAVFALNHRDATCHSGKGSWLQRPDVPFREPMRWTDADFRDRADDVRRLLDGIRAGEPLGMHLDLSRLGLVGHSLGGYTVLGLAGAWPSWKLPGIKAVLALSPYSQPFIAHKTLGGLSVPVMYQGGTLDFAITPGLQKVSGAYDQSPSPKYFVEFGGATHFAWTNLGITGREEIARYSLAFMDRYVKSGPPNAILTHADSAVTTLRYSLVGR